MARTAWLGGVGGGAGSSTGAIGFRNDTAVGESPPAPDRRHKASGTLDDVADTQPILSFDELIEAVCHAPPATPDDVTITMDGRRLDTKDKVLAFLAEIETERAAGVTFEDLEARYQHRTQPS